MLILAAQGLFGEPDWASLGLVSSIVGCFLIANSILFEHPRLLVERYFSRKTGRLRSVREYIYNRVQTTLGFTFLLTGFGLQLVGRYGQVSGEGEVPLPMVWVGVIVIVAVGLLLGGWWWSLLAFRRYVREYFLDHAANLEGDPATAQELGELFGVERFDEDTVEDYVRRLRAKAGLARSHRPQLTVTDPANDPEFAEAEEAV